MGHGYSRLYPRADRCLGRRRERWPARARRRSHCPFAIFPRGWEPAGCRDGNTLRRN